MPESHHCFRVGSHLIRSDAITSATRTESGGVELGIQGSPPVVIANASESFWKAIEHFLTSRTGSKPLTIEEWSEQARANRLREFSQATARQKRDHSS